MKDVLYSSDDQRRLVQRVRLVFGIYTKHGSFVAINQRLETQNEIAFNNL